MGLTHIFAEIAAQNHTTADEVRREIEAAIQAGMNSSDPKVRAQWAKIPRKGDIPTPDELIDYFAQQAKENNAKVLLQRCLS